jgi:hypothetical protein
VLTSIPNQSGVVGSGYSYAPNASGGVTPYTWSASGLPAGITINASTGVFSGNPTTVQDPEVTITVTDSASNSAHTTFGFNVTSSGAPVPVYPPAGVTIGELLFNSTFTGMGNVSNGAGPMWERVTSGSTNGITSWPAGNVNIVGGQLVLTLSAAGVGAQVTTAPTGWPFPSPSDGGFSFQTGYVEFDCEIPTGNWWADWTTGETWPGDEEFDVAENGNSGAAIGTNYHSASASINGGQWGTMPSVGQTVVIGGLRQGGVATSYCNGVLEKRLTNGQGGITIATPPPPHQLVLTMGYYKGPIPAYLKVNSVRVWAIS